MKTSGNLMVSVIDGKVRITRLAGAQTRTLSTWHPANGTAQAVLLDAGVGNTTDTTSATTATAAPTPATSATAGSGRGNPTNLAVIVENDGPVATDTDTDTDVIGGPSAAQSYKFAGPLSMQDGATRLSVLDLSDPAHPRPVRRLVIDGALAGDVRLVNGEVRLAVRAGTHSLAWKQPRYRPGTMAKTAISAAEKRSTSANRKLIDGSTIDDWLPRITMTDLDAAGRPVGTPIRQPLLDCSKVAVPQVFSGIETVAMVSADLRTGSPLSTWRAAGVVASGSTLYVTADHAWLATSRWNQPMPVETGGAATSTVRVGPATQTTQLHLFETPLRGQPRYVASGQVEGSLLNQFAMDEWHGVLRVATTTQGNGLPATPVKVGPPTPARMAPGSGPLGKPGRPAVSQGRVTALKPDGDRLAQIGLITGLGLGEQIRAVRFDGAIGYVVTYRQTDPLYTIDFSDQARPRLRGELKLTGYSAYLHPAGPGRVIGLGRDGTENDQLDSLQLSLFDVGNLDDPQRLAKRELPGAWSDAEADPHAFTMAGHLVLLPFASSTSSSTDQSVQKGDTGVLAARVGADSISKPVILRPIADGPVTMDFSRLGKKFEHRQVEYDKVMNAAPLRVAVHDGLIYTLTSAGIAVHSSSDFSRIAFAAF